jgi:ACS family glucarate transporter-like MFS transporter
MRRKPAPSAKSCHPAQGESHGDKGIVSSQRPTNVRWLVFALACGTSWFLYLHRYTWNFIRPELQQEYGFSNTQLETIYTAFNLSYAVGQIPSGILCDLYGPHILLAVVIALWSLVLPTFGLTGGWYPLGGLRILFGAAQAGGYPCLSNVTRTWFPRSSRTIVQGIIVSFFGRSGGAMSSIIMGTFLVGLLGLSWRWALVVMSAAGVVFAALLLLLYRNRPEEDRRVNQAERDLIRKGERDSQGPPVLPLSRVLRNRSMLVFVFQQFMNAGADFIYVSTMGSYFIGGRNFDVAVAGLLVSLPLWGGAVGGIVGGFVNDGLIYATSNRRWSRRIAGLTGKLLACVFMFVAISQASGLAVAAWLFVVKFFSDWTQPTVWGTCTDMGGRYSATTFSIINTAGNLGALFTPLVAGGLLDYYSTRQVVDGVETVVTNYTPMFVLVAAMYLISACCWLLIDCTQTLDEGPEPGAARTVQ